MRGLEDRVFKKEGCNAKSNVNEASAFGRVSYRVSWLVGIISG
jgi:hypothetical protein